MDKACYNLRSPSLNMRATAIALQYTFEFSNYVHVYLYVGVYWVGCKRKAPVRAGNFCQVSESKVACGFGGKRPLHLSIKNLLAIGADLVAASPWEKVLWRAY